MRKTASPARLRSSTAINSTCISATWAPRPSTSTATCSGGRLSSLIIRDMATAGRYSCGAVLIFSGDGNENPFVAALDRALARFNGKVDATRMRSRKFSFSTPTEINVDGSKQVVAPAAVTWLRTNLPTAAKSGESRYGEGYSVVPRPVFANGVAIPRLRLRPSRSLSPSTPRVAKGDATDTNVVWTLEKGAPLTPSVLVVGDELYFVSDNGVATCIDARTKKNHWTSASAATTRHRRFSPMAEFLFPKRSRRDDSREGRHGVRIAQP